MLEMLILVILGILFYGFYLIIEFALPIFLLFMIVNHPQDTTVWTWIILLVLWFTARMIVYIIKETKKDE